VLGVELSEELNRVGRELIAGNRTRLACPVVELVTADATKWQVPDDVTYVYLYNPFTGEVFQQVIENVIASYDRLPRALTVLYVQPSHERALLDTGRFNWFVASG
jgi:hypothetical protein